MGRRAALPVGERPYRSPRSHREDDLYEDIGAALCRFRLAAKRSQEEAAAAVGYSRTSVTNWESGLHKPSFGVVDALLRFYGATWEAFVQALRDEEATRRRLG